VPRAMSDTPYDDDDLLAAEYVLGVLEADLRRA
jgi:anti-sigma-K factor RskA